MHILIDTLSMTWKYDNVANLYDILNIPKDATQPMHTRHYDNGEYYDGILIAYNLDENYNVTDTFLDISGKGCRALETFNPDFDWFKFLNMYDKQIRSREAHIARIDIACDIDDGSLSISQIQKFSRQELYVCKSKVLPDVRYMRTQEVYFGSPRSDRLLRIYDKALEQGIPDTDWIRIEMQLRNDCATSWYLNWCNYQSNIGELYSGVLLDFLRFVEPPRGTDIRSIKSNRNQGRLPTAKWWAKLLGDVEKIPQLYLPSQEYTLAHLERYLEKQTYSSLKTYLIAHDGELNDLLYDIEFCKLNAKQKILLEKLNFEVENTIFKHKI